jgi:hypothetical protein
MTVLITATERIKNPLNTVYERLLMIERQLSTNSLTIADKLVDNCRHACRQLSLNPDETLRNLILGI